MQQVPSVVVRKGGFLAAVARGLFGFLIAAVVCASGIAVYALHTVDGRIDNVVGLAETIVGNLKHVRENLPPVLADAIDDRRAEDYQGLVSVDVQCESVADAPDDSRITLHVYNQGDRTISLMALNVVLEDAEGKPLEDFRAYAATPLALDEDGWRGPLHPGQTREFVRWRHVPRWKCGEGGVRAAVEVAQLRVFDTADIDTGATPATAAASPRRPVDSSVAVR